MVQEIHNKFKIFKDLMATEIREILLISSRYNIFNLEEDGGLTSKIINEYKGLNISYPPSISGAASVEEAMSLLTQKDFDMALIVPHVEDMDASAVAAKIREKSNMPVFLLTSRGSDVGRPSTGERHKAIDSTFVWSGHPDLLLSLIKNAEDHLNVERDTQIAKVRVLMLVEDSPEYYSYLLPIIYKEIVSQTQALLDIGLNDSQKLLTMRARPKILLAKNYEEATELYQKYQSYLLGVISDTRFPKEGKMDEHAGVALLSRIKKEVPELPLLLMSSEARCCEEAENIPCTFLDKNTSELSQELHNFFLSQLGFGEFVFCMADGRAFDRAANLLQLEEKLNEIPSESICYHINHNHFSNWLLARSEIDLALSFRSKKSHDFKNAGELRRYILTSIHHLRKMRQKGIVSKFNRHHFDPNIREFVKIGEGSLGGKARGLSFMSGLFHQCGDLQQRYPEVKIKIPKTLVICTDLFESFIKENRLQKFSKSDFEDVEVDAAFLSACLPRWLERKLTAFLRKVQYPLAVRSSSQMEDAPFQPYAGLYRTYMIPNNQENLSIRFTHLIKAIKLIYASVYHRDPKTLYKNTSKHPFPESMAVIIQEIAGVAYGDFFYPSISGIAKSYNFYPFSHMQPEDGIVHVALGFGRKVTEGEKSLRFSPKFPNVLPQCSSVEAILNNAQRYFYALKIKNYPNDLQFYQHENLEKRNVDDARGEYPVKIMSSTYVYEENRIRDTCLGTGEKVLTFNRLVKHDESNICALLSDFLDLGRKNLGCPVEIEFAVNLFPEKNRKNEFYFLQIRPMATDEGRSEVSITDQDFQNAFCYSRRAIGNGVITEMTDIVYVKPTCFKTEATLEIVSEIDKINASLIKENRTYLLVGPGRWGSSDRHLGIPVKWHNISGVRAIVELNNECIHADPSQGSHFFHNITTQGIKYITVKELDEYSANGSRDFFNWEWISSLQTISEMDYTRHVRLEKPVILKVDGKKSQCVMMESN